MVSFGFAGKPAIISLEEYRTLAKFGFDSVGEICEDFHNEYYVFLPGLYGSYIPHTEKEIVNICKFLKVDYVIEPGINSLLNISLKADIALIIEDRVLYFQAKSSASGIRTFIQKYSNSLLKPHVTRDGVEYPLNIPNIRQSYSSPGCLYLNTRYGDKTLPLFLEEFSKWLGVPIKEEYYRVWDILSQQKKHISIETLNMILKNKRASEIISQMQTIHPIDFKEGYVKLRQKQTATR